MRQDWGLEQFRKKYSRRDLINQIPTKAATVGRGHGKKLTSATSATDITKEDIFHYVYAVLHNPAYRKKYEINLKRGFPRIPLYDNFWQWAEWGKQLMDLHVNYEKAKGFALSLNTLGGSSNSRRAKGSGVQLPPNKRDRAHSNAPLRAKLKADKDNGAIIIDDETTLTGIPKEAWEYKLGNRSALEWVLDQYKENTPSDPTIAEKFNTYKLQITKKKSSNC